MNKNLGTIWVEQYLYNSSYDANKRVHVPEYQYRVVRMTGTLQVHVGDVLTEASCKKLMDNFVVHVGGSK